MIGIYKITSSNGKIYIGQSTDIEKRFKDYKKINCKKQTILYRSLLKYGYANHKFEVICECNLSELNDLERYYQDFFDCTGKNGMNCRLTRSNDKSGKISYHTRLKMGRKDAGNHLKKIILDTQNGIFYFGAKEAGKIHDIREDTLRLMLNGKLLNKTNLIFSL